MTLSLKDLESVIFEITLPLLPTVSIEKYIDISQSNSTEYRLKINLPFLGQRILPLLHDVIQNKLNEQFPKTNFIIESHWQVIPHPVQTGLSGHPQIKNIIAIASGKGGVGKSTTAVNLALALQAEGAQVGILDADIYGPSQPQMLGSYAAPESPEKGKLLPLKLHGLQAMSIGNLVDIEQPMVWRGPMVSKALQQLLNDTQWHNLDYLIVDLPPGTGDIQLTMAQKIPVSGAVIVTTPQDLALIDARRAVAMFEKVSVPVVGIIENMSTHRCEKCGHEQAIFGQGGGAAMADQYQIPLLGQLPLDINIRQQTDQGTPTVAHNIDSDLAQKYRQIALQLSQQLALAPKDYARQFGTIKVVTK